MIFLLGLIVGLLINPAKQKIVEKVREVYINNPKGKTQFLDPVTFKEKFNKANNIGDVIDE